MVEAKQKKIQHNFVIGLIRVGGRYQQANSKERTQQKKEKAIKMNDIGE